jgi:hypothetical protein
MKTINYLKLQAKNLHRDFKTQKTYFDSSLGVNLFEYAPKFFDVDALVTDFSIDEKHFKLMNAQHIISKLAGFEKWTEMLKASDSALELSVLLFDNMHKIKHEEWKIYIFNLEDENNVILDDEDRMDIFKLVFADVDGHQSDGYDYRLTKTAESPAYHVKRKAVEKKSQTTIKALPLPEKDRKAFIKAADRKFDEILQTIEPQHPELTRKLWNPDQYIQEVLKPEMLPIDRDYALSLIEAFLIHKVIDLATESDFQH